ncbi:hypothetical protein ACFQDN_10255 [Pseudomonas asuensis]|uniref:Lipoprotein with Yx(FWY)xxD motif n=1 Tax=Pseudomonas asuensis TaxID=1825787 RepID=A0ABQ2GNC7_9PSED|nr:hypothetical protein [Pseudomonas asuensis]GGM03677.1 hypothetical protein GCM10009425_13700 [Pseudomonas asuensis]
MTVKALLVATALFASTTALAASPALEKGGVLIDSQGRTLYTYDKDNEGISRCNGKCAENWPPLKVEAEAGTKPSDAWTVIEREDGAMQWTYKGKPLYTFIQDKQPGDKTGDAKGGVWHVAKP